MNTLLLTFALLILGALFAACVGWVLWQLIHAPEGVEDEYGFREVTK